MEKTVIERKYELVVILNAKLSDEEKDEIIKSVIELVKKENGNVINSQVWLDKQKLSFEIKKCTEGTYYIINVQMAASSVSRVRSLLKLDEKVLRFEFIKVDSIKKKEAAKA